MVPKVSRVHRIGLKNQILQAALEVFCKSGYDRTRMDDIAQRSGVSKGTLYLYFKNKEDLFNSIGEAQVERLRSELSEVFSEEGDLAGKAVALYGRLRGTDEGSEAVFHEMIAESSRNVKLKRMLQSQRKASQQVVAEFLKTLSDKGLIAKGVDLEALAAGYVALYTGLGIDIILGSKETLIKRAWSETTKALIEGSARRLSPRVR